jgi:hypothetical protein
MKFKIHSSVLGLFFRVCSHTLTLKCIYLGTENFPFYALYFPHHTHVFSLSLSLTLGMTFFRCYAWHWALRAIWFTCTWSSRIYVSRREDCKGRKRKLRTRVSETMWGEWEGKEEDNTANCCRWHWHTPYFQSPGDRQNIEFQIHDDEISWI